MRPSERFGPDPIVWERTRDGRCVSTGDGRFQIDRASPPPPSGTSGPSSLAVVWRLFDKGALTAWSGDLDIVIRIANQIRRSEGEGAGPKTDPFVDDPGLASQTHGKDKA
jgi:hypothetical protein